MPRDFGVKSIYVGEPHGRITPRIEELRDMLASIDGLQTAIGNFTHLGDDYIAKMKDEQYEIEGQAVRDMQRRLARIAGDLSSLYRRIDS